MQVVGAAIAFGALWDFITTFVGLADIFDIFSQEGDYPFIQLLFALAASSVIMGFVLCTHYLWKHEEGDMITVILKAAWLMCFAFDVWTALLGNKRLIYGGRVENVKSMIIIGMITIIITSSTILLSRIVGQKEEAERERNREQGRKKEKDKEKDKEKETELKSYRF
jgi:hypothetical protein